MIILGIDPGSVSGAMALLNTEADAAIVCDIPTVGKGIVHSRAMAGWITDAQTGRAQIGGRAITFGRINHCFLEHARTMPKQGISSSGKYMHAAGKIEAVVEMLCIPYTLVEANVWKKAMNLRGKDKEAARLRAIQLYPMAGGALSRKRDHGRAEALLIAHYGYRVGFAPRLQAAE